jgi:hypothetical protein
MELRAPQGLALKELKVFKVVKEPQDSRAPMELLGNL